MAGRTTWHDASMPHAILHSGRVRYADERPAAGAIVSIARGTAPTPEIGIRCDAHGRFRIALPPGRYEIEARAPDGAYALLGVETEDEVRQFDIVVAKEN